MLSESTKTDFHITTDSFAGPFELVLELIEARKLLVNDLSLAGITDDFIAHVRSAETFPVEQTANFIQIAATLLLIKSKSLIPDLELTEEEQGDVDDLKRRLEAYERVRTAASELSRIFGATHLIPGGVRPTQEHFSPTRDTTLESIKVALERVLSARETVAELPEARIRPLISIEAMMDQLSARVQKALTVSFKEFTGSAKERVDVIVSFLALLELVKQGAVAAEQFSQYGDIRISHTAPESAPRY